MSGGMFNPNSSSPTTTKGDLIVNDGTKDVRRAIGSDGTFLKADSSQATGTVWASVSGAALAVVSKSGNYTAATSDDIIKCDASGGAFTITLYAASGNTGKVLRIVKTDSSLANAVTIDGNASETINGALTTTLNTQYEEVIIWCDGSNWFIDNRIYPRTWTAYTPTTAGWGTPTITMANWRRDGQDFIGSYKITLGTRTGVEARLGLPSGLIVDTGVVTEITYAGDLVYSGGASGVKYSAMIESGATYMVVSFNGNGSFVKALGSDLFSNSSIISLIARMPITGWK